MKCFSCSQCGKNLRGVGFMMRGDDLYCGEEKCLESLLFTQQLRAEAAAQEQLEGHLEPAQEGFQASSMSRGQSVKRTRSMHRSALSRNNSRKGAAESKEESEPTAPQSEPEPASEPPKPRGELISRSLLEATQKAQASEPEAFPDSPFVPLTTSPAVPTTTASSSPPFTTAPAATPTPLASTSSTSTSRLFKREPIEVKQVAHDPPQQVSSPSKFSPASQGDQPAVPSFFRKRPSIAENSISSPNLSTPYALAASDSNSVSSRRNLGRALQVSTSAILSTSPDTKAGNRTSVFAPAMTLAQAQALAQPAQAPSTPTGGAAPNQAPVNVSISASNVTASAAQDVAQVTGSGDQPDCAGCEKPIKGNHIEASGEPYHERCLRCFSCGKLVSEKYVTIADNIVHIECAMCSNCSTPLEQKRRPSPPFMTLLLLITNFSILSVPHQERKALLRQRLQEDLLWMQQSDRPRSVGAHWQEYLPCPLRPLQCLQREYSSSLKMLGAVLPQSFSPGWLPLLRFLR